MGKDEADREQERKADEPVPADAASNRLHQAAAGIADAQAWKGQQIAKGWRKLVKSLRRSEEGQEHSHG